jgi:hypothetical protein
MAISDMTEPYGDDEREDPIDGEENEASPIEDEGVSFDEDQASENANETSLDDELPLADEETRLPWLEGDEDEDEYGGYSTGQTIALAAAALLVLGLVVGGIWWLSRTGPDADLVAGGSAVKSEGPYKQRPDDPGGKVFDGTGASSFKVSEGQSNPARLGEKAAQPTPGFETLDEGGKAPKVKPSDGANDGTVDTPGVGVQIGAYSDRASAEAGWSRLAQQHGALKGLRHRVLEGQADIGTVYRLQAVADDASAAKALCGGLKSSGHNCYVKR